MRLVVHAAQAAAVHMAVQLRRRERAVAEEVLDRAQVGAALQQVGCERMAQAVGMREHTAQSRRVEPVSASRQEERVVRACGQLRSRFVEVLRHEVTGLFPKWDDPLLAALAAHVELLAVEVHVGEIEPDRFRTAQPRRIDELDEGAITQRQGSVAD